MNSAVPRLNLSQLIEYAIAEDIGDGDHSSLACIPEDAEGNAVIIAKEKGIIAGVELAENIFRTFDPFLQLQITNVDGKPVEPGDEILSVSGNIQSILKSERLVLNFMQRMSGIATVTNKIVSKLGGLNTKILDTRKTTPCLREIEKWAVRIGGGTNHRFGLYDMIMLKDNHIDFAGGITNAINLTGKYLRENGKDLKIEVEVRTIDELREVILAGGVDRVLLDNMTPEVTADAVKLVNGRFETEASGGITIDNVREYAETGVDFISIGALTHSVKSLDLSLKAR